MGKKSSSKSMPRKATTKAGTKRKATSSGGAGVKAAAKPKATSKAAGGSKKITSIKVAAARKPGESVAKAASALGIAPVTTGGGADCLEIGREFVALFNARTPDAEIWDRLFTREFTSVEGFGVNTAFHGRKAVTEKCDGWLSAHTVHGCSCEGPFAGSTGFSVRIQIDRTENATGRREVSEEVAVYTVRDGKIVSEEFYYRMS